MLNSFIKVNKLATAINAFNGACVLYRDKPNKQNTTNLLKAQNNVFVELIGATEKVKQCFVELNGKGGAK